MNWILIVWVLSGDIHSFREVGPFQTKALCERAVETFKSHYKDAFCIQTSE